MRSHAGRGQSRRQFFKTGLGAAAALSALGALAEENGGQGVMGPTVFNWNDMKPEKTSTGEVRHLCNTPTATVDELEMHVTTLNPGMASHPPHRHVNEELIILR